MSRVVLSRLWYMFPADDQNLRPDQFACKVSSHLRALPTEERRALLEFLAVQYEAFQRQLELLFTHGSVTELEYRERSERLARYRDHLHGCLRALDPDARGDAAQRSSATTSDLTCLGTRAFSSQRPPVPGAVG